MTQLSEDWLLEIQRLAIHRNREALVDDASLVVGRGSLHVIVGPNGAGKSTLIGAVLGLIPFDGRIVLNWKHSGAIGYVPQTFPVDPTLPVTVEDFLALTRQRRPVCLGLSTQSHRTVSDCSRLSVSRAWSIVRSLCSRAANCDGCFWRTRWIPNLNC